MTPFELEKLYLDTFKKITGDVPEGVPAGIDINAALGLDSRFVLGCILQHARLMKQGGAPELYRMFLQELNSKIKDAGFTILFDEKVLD